MTTVQWYSESKHSLSDLNSRYEKREWMLIDLSEHI